MGYYHFIKISFFKMVILTYRPTNYRDQSKRVAQAPKRLTMFLATQPVFTCSKLIIETLEQVVKYVQS